MKYLILVAALLTGFVSVAQQNQMPADSIPFEVRKNAFIYTIAKKYNDPAVARMALYNILASTPGSPELMDTLSFFYYSYQQYASAALVAQDALKMNPNDLFAAEIAAISFENLGVKERAITYYEKIYLAENDMSVLYKICFLQYDLKRYGEALNNADILAEAKETDDMKLLFPTAAKKNQEISMRVAAIRLKGMIELDRGNTSEAKAYFQKALDMAPQFELLKQQIDEIK